MRVMIVDDEQPCIEELRFLLIRHPDIEICGEYTNPLDALQAAQKSLPDVIFLDIGMPFINGIDLADRLKHLTQKVNIVFVTAHARLLSGIKNLPPSEFLLKPINKSKLDILLERLRLLA